MIILGLDIGGTGIKAATVNVEKGILVAERHRILTPRPATPNAIARIVRRLSRHFHWTGPIGCGIPCVVKKGVAYTAANLDERWIGTNGRRLFERVTKCPVTLLNDADAAGLAEVRFGAGAGHDGLVVMVTLGTGIGSALFIDGKLVPNTELGHLVLRGKDAERRASERTRIEKALSWKQWAKRVNEYLHCLEELLFPDLIIIGGGVSKRHDKFLPRLRTRAKVVPAQLQNDAGIIGAALASYEAGLRQINANGQGKRRSR
jgi:polyphosphate glucokinase